MIDRRSAAADGTATPLKIALRALSVLAVAAVAVGAYRWLDAETLRRAGGFVVHHGLLIVIAVVLLVVMARLCEFGFASVDAVLDWIHPGWPGAWFRWRPRSIFAVMLTAAALLALALDSRLALWLAGSLRDVAVGLLGGGDGTIARAIAWLGVRIEALLDPFIGASPRLQAWSFGAANRWTQPMALLAGLLTWHFRRQDGAYRLHSLDAARVDVPPATAPTDAPPPRPRKRIVVFCDGTSNSASQKDGDVVAPTNVHRLYTLVQRFDAGGLPQCAIYDPGVGTDTSRQAIRAKQIKALAELIGARKVAGQTQSFSKLRAMWELATGAGILENIEQGYREIVRLYEPGDEIWLFGFSRGAYTVRCIAGVISRCGLLTADNLRFVPDVMLLYRRRPPGREGRLVLPAHIHRDVRIRFMGLWDTVASLGLPLWGWWFRVGALWRHQALNNNPAAICDVVCQALSMDETRSQFMPTLAEPSAAAPDQVIRQVWFRGGHAEVGGGYAEHELADIALRWMADEASARGLGLDAARLPPLTDLHPHAPIRTAVMRNPQWAIFGTWPRWHPADPDAAGDEALRRRFGSLDESVWTRARAAAPDLSAGPIVVDERAAADGLIQLAEDQTAIVTVTADRVWNRTGIVFQAGGVYEIAYRDGCWRDKEESSCAAGGDPLAGLDLARRLFAWARRRPDAPYVELIGHVAHPRTWPAFEFGSFKLMRYFAFRDPWPLRASLIRLGQAMAGNRPAYVELASPSGVFHAFANDLWRTYANNSGSLRIAIRRLPRHERPPPGCAHVVITPRGEAVDRAAAPAEAVADALTRETWSRDEA